MPDMPVHMLNQGRQYASPFGDIADGMSDLMQGINKVRDQVALPKDMQALTAAKADPNNIDQATGGLKTETLQTLLPTLKNSQIRAQVNQTVMQRLMPAPMDPYKQWETKFKVDQENRKDAREELKESGREARDAAREERLAKQGEMQNKIHMAIAGAADERQRKALEAYSDRQQKQFEQQEKMEKIKEDAKAKADGQPVTETTKSVTTDPQTGKVREEKTTTKTKNKPEQEAKGLPTGAVDTGKTIGGKKAYKTPDGRIWTE